MLVDFHFAFELIGNSVYSLGFVIENYCMMLCDVLFAFVRLVYKVRKDLVGQYSSYCDDDLR